MKGNDKVGCALSFPFVDIRDYSGYPEIPWLRVDDLQLLIITLERM